MCKRNYGVRMSVFFLSFVLLMTGFYSCQAETLSESTTSVQSPDMPMAGDMTDSMQQGDMSQGSDDFFVEDESLFEDLSMPEDGEGGLYSDDGIPVEENEDSIDDALLVLADSMDAAPSSKSDTTSEMAEPDMDLEEINAEPAPEEHSEDEDFWNQEFEALSLDAGEDSPEGDDVTDGSMEGESSDENFVEDN